MTRVNYEVAQSELCDQHLAAEYRDLSRLMSLQHVHGGSLRCIQYGVGELFDSLEKAGLVAIESEELLPGAPSSLSVHATITERGIRVVEVGMNAMLKEVENG